MKNNILLLSFFIIFFGCNTKKIERENEPDIYEVQSSDVEMNQAIENAKKTLDSFDIAFKNNSRVFTFFSLKKRFEENGNIEHIWIGNIQGFKDEKYKGVIDNLPEIIKNVKLGDTVEINKNEISDWMYLKNSKLHGGYTIRLLVKRMSKSERNDFETNSGIKL
ncbi:hypothetical protein B6A10_05445 [Flavobacterium sp. L1I52]|uniref:DUF2314 domain-containing protein n=1 Tax=Flavobacterium pokkalii TaxID=1940408 RepID=A0ABR7UPT8_9FLAO|nr:DUF2314 domain-containing protein [Flavobacterium pokkalii]MBD0724617.1 hypothetical protein [Flavobacterium pokkalii]